MARPAGDGETPKRNIRIPDSVWGPAKKRAKQDHTNVSAVVVQALHRYVTSGNAARAATHRTLPPFPDTLVDLLNEKKADVAGGFAFPRQVQMKTFITHIGGGKVVLVESAEVTKLLRTLGEKYRAPELGEVADQLDMAALMQLDEQA